MPDEKKIPASVEAAQIMLDASFAAYVVQIQELYPELGGDDKKKALSEMAKGIYFQANRETKLAFARTLLKALANVFDPDVFVKNLKPRAQKVIEDNPVDSCISAASMIQSMAIEAVIDITNGQDPKTMQAVRGAALEQAAEAAAKAEPGSGEPPKKTPTNVN